MIGAEADPPIAGNGSGGIHAEIPVEDLGEDEHQHNMDKKDSETIDNPHRSR